MLFLHGECPNPHCYKFGQLLSSMGISTIIAHVEVWLFVKCSHALPLENVVRPRTSWLVRENAVNGERSRCLNKKKLIFPFWTKVYMYERFSSDRGQLITHTVRYLLPGGVAVCRIMAKKKMSLQVARWSLYLLRTPVQWRATLPTLPVAPAVTHSHRSPGWEEVSLASWICRGVCSFLVLLWSSFFNKNSESSPKTVARRLCILSVFPAKMQGTLTVHFVGHVLS